MMTIGDHKGWIFISHPHTNNIFFLFSHHVEQHFLWKEHKKASRNPEFAEMRHRYVFKHYNNVMDRCAPECCQCVAVRFLSFQWASTGM